MLCMDFPAGSRLRWLMAKHLDAEIAREALLVLGTAAGALMEDIQADMVSTPPAARRSRQRRATDLSELASDLAVLSAAMSIFARRSARSK
jgi:hypothetical protein